MYRRMIVTFDLKFVFDLIGFESQFILSLDLNLFIQPLTLDLNNGLPLKLNLYS